MATSETQQLDEVILNSRRKMLALGGAALASLAFTGVKVAEAQTTPAYTDADILNFALNLEYLESQFYTLATAGKTIDQVGLGTGAGSAASGGGPVVTKAGGPASCLVPWTIPAIMAYATETASGRTQSRHLPPQRLRLLCRSSNRNLTSTTASTPWPALPVSPVPSIHSPTILTS